MGRGGRVNYQQLKAFERRLAKLASSDYQKFCEACAKELAARLLAKVIKRTPVREGVLWRGWTTAQPFEIIESNGLYEIEIINPVEYASYVEYGHRSRGHVGWTKGHFMMTISADEVNQQAPAILERKLFNMLKEAFDGD